MNKKVVIVIILVLLIAVIGGVSYYFMSSKPKCPSGKVSYSKYYMYGDSIGGDKEIAIAEDNIKTVNGVTYYLIYDKPYTKIISSEKNTDGKNIAKYYEGLISTFNASNFSTYTDATGKYILGEKNIKPYCGDICKDGIQYQSILHKKCIYKRVNAWADIGYADTTTRPLKRGYYDIIGQGIANDYCRYTGNNPNIKFTCHLSDDTNTFAETYNGKNVTDIVAGKEPTDAPPTFVQVSGATKPWYPYGATDSRVKSTIDVTSLASAIKYATINGFTAFAFNENPSSTDTANAENNSRILLFKENDIGTTFWTSGAAVPGFKVYAANTSKLRTNAALAQP